MNKKYNSELISGLPHHCLLTIAIPTFNRPISLLRAIESVINQDLFYSCQLLVVDNDCRAGETLTTMLMKKYQNNKNILYYRNDINLGMYGNWNRCFELADSEFVLLLHNDDYLLSGCIDYVIKVLKRGKISALYLNKVNTNNNLQVMSSAETWGKVRKLLNFFFNKRIIEHKVVLKDTLFGFCLTAPTGFIMKKELFLDNHFFTLASTQWPSDAELQLKLVGEGLLFMSEERLVVKDEDGENEGSKKSTTIPLIATHKKLYFDVYKNERYLLKKLLIYVRLRLIAQGFNVDDAKEVRSIIPSFYYSKWSSCIYKLLSIFHKVGFVLR